MAFPSFPKLSQAHRKPSRVGNLPCCSQQAQARCQAGIATRFICLFQNHPQLFPVSKIIPQQKAQPSSSTRVQHGLF